MTWITLKTNRFLSGCRNGVSERLRIGLMVSVLVLPLLVLACAASVSSDTSGSSGITFVPEGADVQNRYGPDEETLLLRYYPPPDELPKAQIVNYSSAGTVAEGIVLSADWDFDSAVHTRVDGVSLPFIWPKATSIDSSHSAVRFLTDVEPSVVFVEGYARLNPDGSGKPLTVVNGDFDMRGPMNEYECSRFQTDRCMRINQDGFVILDSVPPEIFDLPHIRVFAKWSVNREDDPDGWAMANWVFHITNKSTPIATP